MRLFEIEDILENDKFSSEQFGNWLITVTNQPVNVSGYDKLMYVAAAKYNNKSKDAKFYRVVGNSKQDAIDNVKQQIQQSDKAASSSINNKNYTIDLNVNFTREYLRGHNPSDCWSKFIEQDDKPMLIIASSEYAKQFNSEMKSLKFKKLHPRESKYAGDDTKNQIYTFGITSNELQLAKLMPNARYTTTYENTDDNGNKYFSMVYDSTSMHSNDKQRMNKPGLIVAAIRDPKSSNTRTGNKI